MHASLLEELTPVPNPYPIRSEIEYPEVWRLCEQSRELAWDPRAIDFSDVRDADLPPDVRAAGAEWWSLRAWMEHGAVPYGSERLRDAVFGHQPFEIKQHIVNFIAEELRHHEASVLVAKSLAAYQDVPRADYFKAVIPRFHDERDERAMSFFAGLAVNTLFEQLSGELLQARYENARFASISERLPADPARRGAPHPVRPHRHAPLLRRAGADDKRMLGEKVAKKLRGSLLSGVYAVVNLPPDERERAGRNRALACEHGLGATHPDDEVAIIKRALDQIRADVAPYGVEIPQVPEVDAPASVH